MDDGGPGPFNKWMMGVLAVQPLVEAGTVGTDLQGSHRESNSAFLAHSTICKAEEAKELVGHLVV